MATPQSPIGFFPVQQTSSSSEDMDAADSLRSRTSASTNPATAPRRRTTASAKTSPLCRSQSFSREIGHAASETYLITRLAFTLLRYLGVGRRWISRLLALGLYAMLLMPGFLQVLHQYFFSSRIRRSIVYGCQPRNRLDLYLPENIDSPKPVIIFVTGGAWIIGYKGWGSLLGFQLAERDIIVTCLDYRNFPQGTISDMVEDVSQGISYVCNNIADYGGDPNRIYLMGQSAGAHISSCVLVKQAIKESKGESVSWSTSQIKAYFGLSGGYNLTNLVDHFDRRGLYRSIFLSIMEGDESLQQFSPEILIEDPGARNAVSLLPHIVLFHGTGDFSIPPDSSITFVDTLKRVGARAELILYQGKTHTDLFIQDALRGGKEELFDYIVDYLHAGDAEALANDAMAPPRKRLCPEPLLKLAGLINGDSQTDTNRKTSIEKILIDPALITKHAGNYMQTIDEKEWIDLVNSIDDYLKNPFPDLIPDLQPNDQFSNVIETPMEYGFQKLNYQATYNPVISHGVIQGTSNVNHNPVIPHGVIPMMSSRFNESGASMNVGYTNPTPYFGGSSIKNVASTNVFSNRISAAEVFDGRSRTATPGGLLPHAVHSSVPNFHQQTPFNQISYSMGVPITANDVKPNFQNNAEAAHFLGSIYYNSQTSNCETFLQPPSPRPGRWVRQIPVKDQSVGFKIPRLNSWYSVQDRPLVTEESLSHNCHDLNCNSCGPGPATFGMSSRKRKNHFGLPGNESWSGTHALMESSKRKYPFELLPDNEPWVGSGNDIMESKEQKCHLEQPSIYGSWVGSGTLMDVLLTNHYQSVDLPPLEQWPDSSEDGPDEKEPMGNGPDGKEESSELLGPNASSGTLMDVYNSFIKYSASSKDVMPNNEDGLGTKVNNVPELSCEENLVCGFNSALDDYEAVLESMKSMEWSELEAEKRSTEVISLDDNGPEVEAAIIENPSASLADNPEGNGSGSGMGSRNIKKQSASLADSLTKSQIKEHLSSFIQPQKDISADTTPLLNHNPCQLCSKHKLLLAPTPIYCSSCDLRIKQDMKYYRSTDEKTKTQHCICMGCFRGSRGSTVITRGGSVSKASLHLEENNEEIEDSWVQCDICQLWQHRICGLYNNETDLEGEAEYVCPKCCLKEIENGMRISLPKPVVGAKDLPRTNLSDHIEQRLLTRMKQEREETAKFHGIVSEKVPVAEGLVVRVVVSVDKELEVKKQFRDIFDGQDYPEKIEYRSKLILLFQNIGGVDICLFGMYVQEFGSECNGPNKRCVYISYIDSVKYFQPERKTASGEPLRTFVYHEILIGYLEHCKKRGFASCYIWSCPLIKGEDYIFYRHPKIQKTPEKSKLRQWYKLMIKKAVKDGIVVDQTNLYNEFFIPSNIKVSAARLPYFAGDCWSEAAENISKKLDEEESPGGRLCSKSRTKRNLVANGQEKPTKDALVMQDLGHMILPEKENFMILRLQHVCTSCNEVILSASRWFCSQCNKIHLCSRCVSRGRMRKCGSCKDTLLSEDVVSDNVPLDTKDNDEVLVNNFFGTRDDFLNKCQTSLYQFDTLGNAKYSSMMILHHFKHSLSCS
ncbi:hypothetical protein SSX86_029131 [Deinandra increscens subsp. villosa]|uniref:CBP/p300-type HAT domain-containing protein n=1 Tax=Deinandra increscens subsp. villosa TaxID=3103831 RepID=A0AAP0CE87_9ASTR